jgi:Arc/MetJ family transcription regulator
LGAHLLDLPRLVFGLTAIITVSLLKLRGRKTRAQETRRQYSASWIALPLLHVPLFRNGSGVADPAKSVGRKRIPFTIKSEPSFPLCHVDKDSNFSENVSMKTTVNIPDKVLRDAMRHTKAKTKREAIVKALEEMNRRHSQAELLKYTGKFESLMTNEEIEAMEEEDWKSWTPFRKGTAVSKKRK